MRNKPRVAVLGGGLTGTAIALELARAGVGVMLIEQDGRLLNRASLRNEGKIHLGLIYANEGSLDTARLQLKGALNFRSSLARWIGDKAQAIPCSTPFAYLVAGTSLCTPEHLESHYAEVERVYRSHIRDDPSLDYLGMRPEILFRRQPSIPGWFRKSGLLCSFETQERAIDTQVMAEYLRTAISENPLIHTRTGWQVRGVSRTAGGLRVEGSNSDGGWRHDFEQVVNALWDGRIEIDRCYGLQIQPGWVYRLKYRTIARLPAHLSDAPSATMVLGRYGDVVIRPDGTAYLSWYPAGMKGWSHGLKPPVEWAEVCRSDSLDPNAQDIAAETLREIDKWYPGIGLSTTILADAGVICAYGHTDIDDRESALHGRAKGGVTSDNGFHSVDAGKLTTAPLFGRFAAQAVLEH